MCGEGKSMGNWLTWVYVEYDTIRDAIITRAHKLMEPTTEKVEKEKE